MQNAELTDILKKVRGGEDSAFEVLAEKYSPLIASVCARYMRLIGEEADSGASADMRQEVTYALYRAAVSYDVSQSRVTFGRYAKRCLENRAVSFIRKMSSARRRERRTAERLRKEHHTFEDIFPGVNPGGKSAVLEAVSGCLSPYEYSVFTRYAEGLSAEEIARELGKDEKSVNNAVFRSKVKIRRFYS